MDDRKYSSPWEANLPALLISLVLVVVIIALAFMWITSGGESIS